MEIRNQELRRVEENLRNLLREQAELQAEKNEKAIQELKEQQRKDMKEIRSLLLGLQSISITNPASNSLASTQSGREFASNKLNAPKLTRLDFLKFGGEGLHEWLFKCDQFYHYDGTLDERKVRIAALHLEGKALQWHQNFIRNKLNRDFPNWNKYTVALNIRFGNDLHYDPMAELMNLKQLGSVQT